MRGAIVAMLMFTSSAAIAESSGLHSIAGWLKLRGQPGFIGADVADAMGITRLSGEAMVDAMQRGFHDGKELRVAQVIEGDTLLFMVQSPDEVVFYVSSVRGGLRKALVSMPSRKAVSPLGAARAEATFRREVLYWQDKAREQ
jgi:hypothetical protein